MPVSITIAISSIHNTLQTAVGTTLFFCGAIGFLSFFILVILLKTRDGIYFYYFCFLFFSLVGGVINLKKQDFFAPTFLTSNHLVHAGLELVTLLAFSAYCLFTNYLLEIRSKDKKLFWGIRFLASLSVVYGLAYWFIRPSSPHGRLILFIVSRVVILFISIVAILRISKKISSPVKAYFLIGSSFYFLGALFAVIRDAASGIPFPLFYHFESTAYFQTGILLEILCFTLALSYRIFVYYEDRKQDQIKINTLAIYEKEKAQAEALALRIQINPHFLFNYLNVLKYYIQIKQNQKAIQYLVKFSQFIRKILDYNEKPVISLGQELEIIENYLNLEKIRYDESFSFHIQIDKETDIGQLLVPQMVLQPFVEEALWNGTRVNNQNKSEIKISIHQLNSLTTIIIEVNGMDENRKRGKRVEFYRAINRQVTAERIELFNKNYDGKISYHTLEADELKRQNKRSKTIVKIQYTR